MSEADIKPTISTKELENKAIYEDLEGNRVKLNPDIPFTHKWFQGEFHTASWGSEASPLGGKPKQRVRVSMMGKKLQPTVHNGTASVYGVITAVLVQEDREFINKSGWWRTESLSHSTKNKRRRKI